MLIELCGTPSSGKSATIDFLKQDSRYAPLKVIEESILRCPFNDDSFDLGILWTIFDTYTQANRVMNSEARSMSELIVFNRGMFDRMAFARLLRRENSPYAELADRAEIWLRESKQLLSLDKIFLFLTSYEKAKARKMQFKLRQGSTFRVVNSSVIGNLNAIYLEIYQELKDDLPIVLLDDFNSDLSLDQKIAIVNTHLSGAPVNHLD